MAINVNNLPSDRATTVRSNQPAKAEQSNTQQVTKQTVQQQQSRPAQDSVSLTQQAQQMKHLQNKLSSSPSLNNERINALKKAIAEGEYKVDPEKLAKSMANLELDLFD